MKNEMGFFRERLEPKNLKIGKIHGLLVPGCWLLVPGCWLLIFSLFANLRLAHLPTASCG
jgi:hypothetical protein